MVFTVRFARGKTVLVKKFSFSSCHAVPFLDLWLKELYLGLFVVVFEVRASWHLSCCLVLVCGR